MKVNTYLIVTRYLRSRTSDRQPYVTFACERGGTNKSRTKPIVDDEEEEIPIKRQSPYGTKKCGCPFKLKGKQMATKIIQRPYQDEEENDAWAKHVCSPKLLSMSIIGILCNVCQILSIYTTSGVGDTQVALNNPNQLVPRIL
ncbi:hypothetical protein M9H77_11981 [Catharanthus roseus]|uniref:Uncharacterized protein n=1 Tax=Catharanthus roseus TaxID=4058 RepID=A0ACC0BG53_CATRO|nr:hypothetical protein M9H77_11981 [Catharanthus roseus]